MLVPIASFDNHLPVQVFSKLIRSLGARFVLLIKGVSLIAGSAAPANFVTMFC